MDAIDIEFGPAGTFLDPASEESGFFGSDGMAFGRHDFVGVFRGDAMEEGAFFR